MKRSIGAKTILHPTPVLIVGSYDEAGKPNMMTVAWGGICCSKPPCLNVSLRKATHSYAGLVARQAFTVNVPSVDQIKQADYVGIYSGRDEDKFAATGLTPTRSQLVNAPYIEEFPLVIECKIIHTIEIDLHTEFIGEIMDVKADEAVLDEKGLPDITKVRPFVFEPNGRRYFALGENVGQAFSIGKKD